MQPAKKVKRELDPKRYKKLVPEPHKLEAFLSATVSRKTIKLFEVFRHNEEAKMRAVDAESFAVEHASDRRACSAEPARPEPAFQMGQSVHHFWASWMHGAKVPRQTNKKKGRPAWYSTTIVSCPVWETLHYGGVEITGWTYARHSGWVSSFSFGNSEE